jgi:anti-sigma regulatory factor (Ser/Thr protein kinase)
MTLSHGSTSDAAWRTLAAWTVPSEIGNERSVMTGVAEAVRDLELPVQHLERLKTAVGEVTMNAIEHGNGNRPELPVAITVLSSRGAIAVRIADQGLSRPIAEPDLPDLTAKLAGRQGPRGWGLFLIRNLVDEMHISDTQTQHTVELILYREGGEHAGHTP